MRTDKQSAASRANGAKSNGPKTREGKARSSGNGNRHNLTGSHIILLSTEDPVEFLHHEQEYINRFQPIDGVERDLVRKLIAASWREKRMDVMEASLLELEMQKQSPKIAHEFEFIGGETRQTLGLLGTEEVREAWNLLSRYQAAARRSYTSAFRALKELQGDRFNKPPAIAEVIKKPAPEEQTTQTNPVQPEPPVSRPLSSVSSLFTLRHLEIIEIPTEPERAIPAGCSVPLAA